MALVWCGFSSFLFAAVSPPGYLEMTALEKQRFHFVEGVRRPSGDLPGIIEIGCGQGVAALNYISADKMLRTFTEPSGYAGADDWIREHFGKGVHSRGPMASGTFVLSEPIMGLEPGEHPVTFRFSLAQPFVLIFGKYRPGILVIIHRDGLPDMNLVLMPKDALTGYFVPPNPLALDYTHWLDKPWPHLRALGAMTFGRVVEDIYTQHVTDAPLQNYARGEQEKPSRQTSKQIIVTPDRYWADQYASRRGNDYRTKFSSLFVEPEQPPFLHATVRDPGGVSRRLGEFYLTSGWMNSIHADEWFAQHLGFLLR